MLTDLSGPYASLTGKGSGVAAQMAVQDFGGQLFGLTIEVVVADHQQKAMPVNDFYSKNVELRADGRAVRDFYLFRVKDRAQSKGRWDYYDIVSQVPGAQAFPASASECPLMKPRSQ